MKTFSIVVILLFGICLFSSYYSGTQEKYFVFDEAGILDSLQREKLNNLYLNHERTTTNQIVLLTTDSFYPDSTIEDYSLNKFRSMGIGQKDINNGILIVFSASMRQVRIETGYGTEKVLKDTTAKRIIDSTMIPQFKQLKYFEGLWNGSNAITIFLEKPENKIK